MPNHSVLSVSDIAKAPILGFNQRNWDQVRAATTPDCTYDEIASERVARGVNEVLAMWQGWVTALPDAKATVLSEHVSGTTVVLELLWGGIHAGPLHVPDRQLPPTGKAINLRSCQIIETADDKVAVIRHYFDLAALLRQIGKLPLPK
jgi:steroid delta-isomerase-like uncharacterized protein